nr:hypothetical protein [Tanacetum cinerariifolium]
MRRRIYKQEFKDYMSACGIVQQLTPPYTPQHSDVSERRNDTLLNMRDTPDNLQQRSVKYIFVGYPKETMGYYFYFPPENKIVVASEHLVEAESLKPQEDVAPIRSKWLDAMNAEMQSMKDNQVWRLVDLPPNAKTVEIMYAVRCTKHDVAFVRNITICFYQNPGEDHWTVVKNILKYIRNTKDLFLVYGGNLEAKLRVTCYCDAGFETDYIFILNAASKAAIEAVWIRKFISGLGIVPTNNKPIKMYRDNSAALLIANEPGVHKGARHYHYIRECIELGKIDLLKVQIDNNLADPFTKALPKGKFTQHPRSIGLHLVSNFM